MDQEKPGKNIDYGSLELVPSDRFRQVLLGYNNMFVLVCSDQLRIGNLQSG